MAPPSQIDVALRRVRTTLAYARAGGRLRRRLVILLIAVAVVAIAWLVITALLARRAASQLSANIQQVRGFVAAGQLSEARALAAKLPGEARHLHDLTTGPVWWSAAALPWIGEPAETLRGVASAADHIGTQAIPELVRLANSLDPKHLRIGGSRINITALSAAGPQLDHASAVVGQATTSISHLPAHTWLHPLDNSVAHLVQELSSLREYLLAASRAASVLPDMLGAHGPKRYFVGLQNESELRGTGGLPGSFAIAVANHGAIHFTRFGADTVLLPAATGQLIDTGLHFGAGFDRAYGASLPTTQFVDSNVSPNFPYAGQIWARMYEKVSGQHIDGAVALDPTVLSYLLNATGPVAVPPGTVVNAQNVVALTERDAYNLFPDTATRKQFLVSILKATATDVTRGAGLASALAQAIVRASKEQRFLAWSSDPRIERVLAQTSYAGAIPTGDQPLAAPIVNNAAAGKLDFYVSRSLAYQRTGCGSVRDVLATITLVNDAPAHGLSPYVTDRLDNHPGVRTKPGDTRELLDYYATRGAELDSVTVNGQPAGASVLQDLGHPIFRLDLELPRGTTTTVILHLSEPAGTGAPMIWRQPGVTPLAVSRYDQAC